MNFCTISGILTGDIVHEVRDTLNVSKFKIKNLYYKPRVQATDTTLIRCIAYGAVADYVNNELYQGSKILVTGRLLNRKYIVENKTTIYVMYLCCDTVALLEQEEYC